jgi:hypothetical protein
VSAGFALHLTFLDTHQAPTTPALPSAGRVNRKFRLQDGIVHKGARRHHYPFIVRQKGNRAT